MFGVITVVFNQGDDKALCVSLGRYEVAVASEIRLLIFIVQGGSTELCYY